METQNIVNLLNDFENKSLKLAIEKGMSFTFKMVKFMVKAIKLVQTLNLRQKLSNQVFAVTNSKKIGDENTDAAFKNCTPFTKCINHINDKHIDTADNINITIPMYNLIEYSDNYPDTSGVLWQFKKDELPTMLLQIIYHHSNTNQVF